MASGSEIRLGTRALVIGAGMGGMMAAEVLSRFFESVLVLDRDTLPDSADPRLSVPQGAHAHTLLVQGRRNLERLFPGLTSALLDRGAVCSRIGQQFIVRDAEGWQARRDLHLPTITMSRPLLETTVREFLARNARVEIRADTPVEGWRFEGGRLAASLTRDGETHAADLTIDATGRSGGSRSWIEAGGFGPVEETALEIGTCYASALFRKPRDWDSPVDSMAISARDPDTRGAFVFSIENDMWIASLTGRFDQAPSGDPDKFLDFAKSLCTPEVHDWLSRGERLTPIKVYRAPVSRWRHYERLADFPSRVLPVGDAYAHVNPVFGQGMTLASEHVMGLWKLLAERAQAESGLESLAAPYFANIEGFTRQVWQGLENIEFAYGCTKGDRPADVDMRIAYVHAVKTLMAADPELHTLFMRVGNLVDPTEVLMRPDIYQRVTGHLAARAAQ